MRVAHALKARDTDEFAKPGNLVEVRFVKGQSLSLTAARLLALMILTDARRLARTAPDGSLVPLLEQDRGAWDRELIAEGQDLVRACLRRNRPGPYQLQAAIAAVHADAAVAADTDWRQILALYDQLMIVAPTPVVALNRCVAVAEAEGPAAALHQLDAMDQLDLAGYHLFHAARADLLRRLGRSAEAATAYNAAIERTGNETERSFLTRQRDSLDWPAYYGRDHNRDI